ncbi:hypothetical protein [Microseira sp. BLCC-F43]|uniref:hypothetical protein n=1 Tax=Microseira sp. BLCC-F43 TaxID=3153602 RepID=UPI0035BA990F
MAKMVDAVPLLPHIFCTLLKIGARRATDGFDHGKKLLKLGARRATDGFDHGKKILKVGARRATDGFDHGKNG